MKINIVFKVPLPKIVKLMTQRSRVLVIRWAYKRYNKSSIDNLFLIDTKHINKCMSKLVFTKIVNIMILCSGNFGVRMLFTNSLSLINVFIKALILDCFYRCWTYKLNIRLKWTRTPNQNPQSHDHGIRVEFYWQ